MCIHLFFFLIFKGISWASLIAQLVKNLPANAGDPGLIPGSGRSPGERHRLPISVFLGFPCGSAGKESACNAGDQGSIPGLGRSPGEGKGCPFQYSCVENSMDSPWSRRESDITERLSHTQRIWEVSILLKRILKLGVD